MKKFTAGFTLIELMIAVAIVGIIAAIAYPSYQSSIRKSNRAEAKTELMDLSQRLQRCYTSYARFNDDVNCAVYKDLKDGGYITRGSGYYKVTISHTASADTTTYSLKAEAIKSPQTQDTLDGCNELTLAHTGAKTPEVCW
jgi:type IV pilus assembly protein PilE